MKNCNKKLKAIFVKNAQGLSRFFIFVKKKFIQHGRKVIFTFIQKDVHKYL